MRVSPELVAALESAPIPRPFSLKAYWQGIQRIRRRRIHMHDFPLDAPGAVSGVWIATKRRDHIFVVPSATGVLRQHIMQHEISHMLLNHGRVGDAETALQRLLQPIVGAFEEQNPLGGAWARSRYDTPEEREAEELATLILMRIQDPHDEERGLRMIEQSFGYERTNGGHW
ncbi:hypothetical protein ACFWYW_46970 [Nonomuraea sp. NPDC059023]|uniref:hypothetical protein n=1 Tax=unclassified Nonomuraea TaxID=2593643 RepID=UPI0036B4240F